MSGRPADMPLPELVALCEAEVESHLRNALRQGTFGAARAQEHLRMAADFAIIGASLRTRAQNQSENPA